MSRKKWHVCEIREMKALLEQFSVSAVPVSWMIKKKGKMYCYWPKDSPGKKIKSAECPPEGDVDEGGEWALFKCRLLMKGGDIFNLLLFSENIFSILTILPVLLNCF